MPSGAGRPDAPVLAEQLEALKQRSGRSYAALAYRTGLSRSTLHRYCQGTTVPAAFGTVELVARVCGADRSELDRLYRSWRRAVAGQEPGDGPEAEPRGREGAEGALGTGDGAETGTEAGAETGAQHSVPGGAEGGPRAGAEEARSGAGGDVRSLPGWPAQHWLRAVTLLLALVVTSAVSVTSYRAARSAEHTAPGGSSRTDTATGEQRLEGPLWSVSPRRVPSEFFGLTLNTDTGGMPGFRTGAVRLWDSETRWGLIEKRPRHYDWSGLDRMVDSAGRRGLPVLFTFGGTPRWAAPDGRRSAYQDSRSSPPDDLKDWDRFVGKVAERYRDRIEAYELWDYPSHRLHWAGSVTTLAEMVERASGIIRRADPGAVLACPSFGRLWTEQGRDRLREFARTGAYDHCHAAALKLPPRRATRPPEESIELARKVQALLYEEGVGDIPVWNTGTDRDVAVTDPLDARRARDYAVRFYLSGVYSRHYGVRRTYFYSWGSTGVPLVVQPVGGRPTEAGVRMGRLMDWLDGAGVTACGEGARMGLAGGAYVCRFVRGDDRLLVAWTTRGRAGITLAEGAYRLRRMDGGTAHVREGDRVGFGEEPVLVEHHRR